MVLASCRHYPLSGKEKEKEKEKERERERERKRRCEKQKMAKMKIRGRWRTYEASYSCTYNCSAAGTGVVRGRAANTSTMKFKSRMMQYKVTEVSAKLQSCSSPLFLRALHTGSKAHLNSSISVPNVRGLCRKRAPMKNMMTVMFSVSTASSASSTAESNNSDVQQFSENLEGGVRRADDSSVAAGGDAALQAWARDAEIEGLGNNVVVARFATRRQQQGDDNEMWDWEWDWEEDRAMGLRGMVAVREVLGKGSQKQSANEVIVSVPQPKALEVTSLKSSSLPFPGPDTFAGITSEYWREAPWFVKLSLKLLYEKSMGAKSDLVPYIATLPKRFDTCLIYWTAQELEELQYPPLINDVLKQKREWQEYHRGLTIDFDDFLWAMLCVRSRCFSGPYEGSSFNSRIAQVIITMIIATLSLLNSEADGGNIDLILGGAAAVILSILARDVFVSSVMGDKLKRYVLCPIIDHFNHLSNTKSDISYSYWRNRFELTIDECYRKGEQVFISYGPYNNDALLQYYGFVEDDNPNDSVSNASDAIGALSATSIDEDVTRMNELQDRISFRQTRRAAGESSPTQINYDDDMHDSRSLLALRFRINKKKLLLKSKQ